MIRSFVGEKSGFKIFVSDEGSGRDRGHAKTSAVREGLSMVAQVRKNR